VAGDNDHLIGDALEEIERWNKFIASNQKQQQQQVNPANPAPKPVHHPATNERSRRKTGLIVSKCSLKKKNTKKSRETKRQHLLLQSGSAGAITTNSNSLIQPKVVGVYV
jgi:hypothetical protein